MLDRIQVKQELSSLAIASLVIGVVAIVGLLSFTLIGIALSVIGVIFGVFAIGMIRKSDKSGLGLARAGLICSLVALAVPVSMMAYLMLVN
ncbi:DUF4190 domain-containing protein [Alkalibacillus silvisoli]|uniref:DUF4190 domain-containing protein n=1 Tax=Alkalibacillus silvisoli TaxID=392823 RepID=A0ABN0ZKN3_9BACI